MENKPTLILVGVMGLVSTLSLAVLFVLVKPTAVKEEEKPGVATLQFPTTGGTVRPPPPPPAQPVAPAGSSRQQGSSLGFIQKDANMKAEEGGEAAKAAAEAARGDAESRAKGAVEELAHGKLGKLSNDVIREAMQRIVDIVHRKRPSWYREFLSKSDLKAVADRYDESKDFKAFLKELANSANFNRMLSARKGTPAMKSLVKALLKDPALGKNVQEMFVAYATDPNARTLLRKYGKSSGVPDSLITLVDLQKKPSADAASAGKLNQRRVNLPKMNFGDRFGGSGGGETPSGVNPEQMKKLLQNQN